MNSQEKKPPQGLGICLDLSPFHISTLSLTQMPKSQVTIQAG